MKTVLRKTVLRFSFGNTKVMKLPCSAAFGLPAYQSRSGFRVCPHSGVCASLCYAQQGHYRGPDAQASREHNLHYARSSSFANILCRDLERLTEAGINFLRLHDSGDFFSLLYLRAWAEAARLFPEITFYCYSKEVSLFRSVIRPQNFRATFSFGGKEDHLIDLTTDSWARIYPQEHQLYLAMERGQIAWNGSQDDLPAILEKRGGIGLCYHGDRPIRPQEGRLIYR